MADDTVKNTAGDGAGRKRRVKRFMPYYTLDEQIRLAKGGKAMREDAARVGIKDTNSVDGSVK
jgi:hypothetical protein